MLLRLIYFTLIVSLFSCSKNPTKEPLVGSVSFSVNGTSYNWRESSNNSDYLYMFIYTSTTGTYHFTVTSAGSTFPVPFIKEIFLTFPSTSLTTNTPFTYTNTNDSSIYRPSIVVSASTAYDPFSAYRADIGDYSTVTITGIHDKRADGSFSARLTRVSDLAKINIINGTFKNVEITP